MVHTKLFSKKQEQVLHEYFHNKQWQLMINYGGVRGGKTYINNYLFLLELKYTAQRAKQCGDVQPKYILAGTSSKTIYNNVISEIENTFGLVLKQDDKKSYHIKFKGLPEVVIVQAYTGSIAGLRGIRGMTSYGAYINEASLAVEPVFNEIRKRCSVAGSRVICDTNPDIPTHYLKTKYIDNSSKYIISNHFTIFDNDSLPKSYVDDQVETTPKGMFYDRDILGLWVSGEGMVYDTFDKDENIISQAEFDEIKQNHDLVYYAGVDWGFQHKNAIVLLADDDLGNTYVVSCKGEQHKSIDHYIDEAHELQDEVRIAMDIPNYKLPFYCDSARPDNIAAFVNSGLDAQNAYKKNILKRIEVVSKKITRRKLKFVDEPTKDLQDNMYKYVWNEKTGLPLKEDDDLVDGFGYGVATRWYRLQNDHETIDDDETFDNLADLGF